jgi:hypothetical protein
MARAPRRLAALALGVAGLACNTGKTVWQLGIPGVKSPFVVASVKARGEVLDVLLQGSGFSLRSFAPADDVCRQVLAPEQRVQWIASGSHGAFRRDDLTCPAAGIGSLEEWRARGPRPQTLRSDPVPRAQANYRVVYQDAEVTFLRGSFPLASRLGWAGSIDTIAVIPRTPVCEGPASRTTSSLEYFPKGARALALVGADGLCPLVGLIRP